MKNEEQTICRENGKRCGNIFRLDVSRMEEHLGHRKYQCDKCKKTWKFGVK